MRVCLSCIAKFRTRNERDTDLAQYADRKPAKIHEKALEQKIQNHKKELLRKDLGSEKIKRSKKQSDDVSVISSRQFCISTTSNVARALKIHFNKSSLKHVEAFKNRPDLTQILFFSPIQPITAPPTEPSSSGSSASQIAYTATQRNI